MHLVCGDILLHKCVKFRLKDTKTNIALQAHQDVYPLRKRKVVGSNPMERIKLTYTICVRFDGCDDDHMIPTAL
jgi:hypothetical protein